jgi:hypothetical protein
MIAAAVGRQSLGMIPFADLVPGTSEPTRPAESIAESPETPPGLKKT